MSLDLGVEVLAGVGIAVVGGRVRVRRLGVGYRIQDGGLRIEWSGTGFGGLVGRGDRCLRCCGAGRGLLGYLRSQVAGDRGRPGLVGRLG